MQIDPRRLAVLLGVHRAGTVTAAARQLHLTASAVSQQMAALERETGVTVLLRQPSGVVLTEAGRALVDVAERIESELADARRALADLDGQVSGTVRLAAFQTVVRALLVPLVPTLSEVFPGVEIVLHEAASDWTPRGLREGSIDLLLLEADTSVGRRTPAGQHDVPVLDEPWSLVLPTSIPRPTTLDDLQGATWLGTDEDTAAAAAMRRVHATFSAPPSIRHSYGDYDVAIEMVAGGLGVAILPSLALQRVLPESVRAMSLPGLGMRRIIARHRASRAEPRPEVRAVLTEIIAAAERLPPVVE